VAKGAVGTGMEVDGFPANITVKVDDLVLTSGLGGILPPNLIVGKVLEKISSQSEATQKFLVEPLLDFRSLEFMQVVKN
jgi:cell shape-determining protein MreC